MLREHDHAVLPREETEAKRIVAARRRAVVVEIEAGVDTCVRLRHIGVRVDDRVLSVLTNLEVVAAEQIGSQPTRVVVELVDQHDGRPVPG